MLKKLKRCLTAFIAAAVVASCSGCTTGESTAYTMSVDGFQLKSGVYIYYQNSALSDAERLVKEENPDIDTEDKDALETATVQGKPFLEWVHNKTLANCSEHIAVIKKFDELGLSLSDEDIESVNDYAESIFEDTSNEYYSNGVGEESFKEVLLNTFKSQEIFLSIYGEGGSENIQESEIRDYFVENNARVRYVGLDLHDPEGNVLDDAGKNEIKSMADKYLAKVKNAGTEEAMLKAFDEVQEEYDQYVQDKTAEASGEEATEETTEATEPTTEAVTEPLDDTATDADTDDADLADGEETEETTTAVTTAPESSEGEEATTTTTTSPYANESIIAVVTTDENTKEEDLTYNPSKTFYDWVYNSSTRENIPEIIEDENTIYVAVKLDIKKRMTEDDLWSESKIDSTRFAKFKDQFQDKLDEWVKALNIDVNEDAVDRYEPFNYEVPATKPAAAAY